MYMVIIGYENVSTVVAHSFIKTYLPDLDRTVLRLLFDWHQTRDRVVHCVHLCTILPEAHPVEVAEEVIEELCPLLIAEPLGVVGSEEWKASES